METICEFSFSFKTPIKMEKFYQNFVFFLFQLVHINKKNLNNRSLRVLKRKDYWHPCGRCYCNRTGRDRVI